MSRTHARRFGGAVVLLAALVASCVPPTSRHPLSDPAQAKADPRLVGLWTDGTTTLHVIAKTGPFVDLVLVGDDGDKGAVVLTFDAFPSTIAGKTYLNLRAKTFTPPYADSSQVAEQYLFARYELTKDGSLSVFVMQDELVKQAVRAGKLEGTVTAHDEVELTASSEALAAFVAAADGAALFKKSFTVKKLARKR